MRVVVNITAQLVKSRDGRYWVSGVYGYQYFLRFLDVFEHVRLVARTKKIAKVDTDKFLRVDGKGVEIYELPFYRGPKEYARQSWNIRNALQNAFDGCDCAIVRSPDEIAFALGEIAQKRNIPFCAEISADCWDFFAPGTMKTPVRPFLRVYWHFRQKRLCKIANGVSYVTKKYLQRRYRPDIRRRRKGQFEACYTTADLTDDYYAHVPKKDFHKNGAWNLVNVSGINSYMKGHKELIHCLKILVDEGINVHVKFIGGGVMLEHFQSYACKMGLGEHVEFLGQIKERGVITQILMDSDIFVFPTMAEGLPRAVLEAMALGLPCLASDVGGVSELLDQSQMLTSNNTDEMALKIKGFFASEEFLASKSKRNIEKSKEYASGVIQNKRRIFYGKLKKIARKNG